MNTLSIAPITQKRLLLPQNFDIKQYLPEHLHEFAWEACYLVHQIAYHLVFEHRDFAGTVNLKYDYLRIPMADKLPQLREALIRSGVIWCDFSAVNGLKAYSYGFHEAHRGPFDWVVVNSPRLIATIAENEAESRPTLKIHRDLSERLSWLDFDAQRAARIINGLDLSRNQREAYRTIVSVFEAGCLKGSDCDYGRFHSELTRMPSCLRGCLSFKGRQLSSIDIKNSQPMVLNLVVSDFYNNKKKLKNFNGKEFHKSNRFHGWFDEMFSELQSPPVTSICLNSSLSSSSFPHSSLPPEGEQNIKTTKDLGQKANLPPDALDYLEKTTNGTLYEHLNGGQLDPDDRRDFKGKFFGEYLYAKTMRGTISKRFKEEFPSVDLVVRHFKSKSYKFLSQLMQKYESNLMINHISRRWIEEYPVDMLGTIHDSLIVEK